jgi:hypothetical protein
MKNPLRLLYAVIALFVVLVSSCKKEESVKPVADGSKIDSIRISITPYAPHVDTFYQPNYYGTLYYDTVFIAYLMTDSVVVYSNSFGPERRSFVVVLDNIDILAANYLFYYATVNPQTKLTYFDNYTLNLSTTSAFFSDSTFSGSNSNIPLLFCSYDQEFGCANDAYGRFIGIPVHQP